MTPIERPQPPITATTNPAATICIRELMVMKRTWPCERMKNSRSGNQLRRRLRSPPTAIVFTRPRLSRPKVWQRASGRGRDESNFEPCLQAESKSKRDELWIITIRTRFNLVPRPREERLAAKRLTTVNEDDKARPCQASLSLLSMPIKIGRAHV